MHLLLCRGTVTRITPATNASWSLLGVQDDLVVAGMCAHSIHLVFWPRHEKLLEDGFTLNLS